ncbi:MAG: hypothetical protein WB347_12915, partial [Terriglobales bacterium]
VDIHRQLGSAPIRFRDMEHIETRPLGCISDPQIATRERTVNGPWFSSRTATGALMTALSGGIDTWQAMIDADPQFALAEDHFVIEVRQMPRV